MAGDPIICAKCGEVISPAAFDETFEVWAADGKPRHKGLCPKWDQWEPPSDYGKPRLDDEPGGDL